MAFNSAQIAHDTATHKENIAENKYDTLGLEAAYLAYGQTQRVIECDQDIQLFENLKVKNFEEDTSINIGALVVLQYDESIQLLFISPCAGGAKIQYCDQEISLVTTTSPIGKQLLGKYKDDEIELVINGIKQTKQIIEVI
ncbi:transcription elongation factor GreAB [Marinicellulosiphila megalodicopiae]|uniref:transcription elongation factor GreAB n=1 Tax=Marinicellulosiphila megalodicopiae TaxID=2724896 RepID=UPI003BAF7362